MRPSPLVVALLCLVPAALHAQPAVVDSASARVRGLVLDRGDGAPVAANLLWSVEAGTTRTAGTGRSQRTDGQGRFLLRVTPPGTVTLRVRALGYRPRTFVIPVRAGLDTTLEVRLAPVAVTLAAVRTIGTTPDRQRFDEAPDVGSFSVSGRTLARMPAVGEGDLLRAVATLPGASARNDYIAGINVRGGEADQNLVLLDGIPIYNPFHFGGLFGTFIDESVERLDLLAGAFPAAHGGRLSSVLDVHTVQEARQGIHGAAELSLLASTLTLGGATHDARGSWNVAARRTWADVVTERLSDRVLPYHFQDVQARGSVLVPGGGSLSLTAYAGLDELTQPEEVTEGCAECGEEPFRFDWGNRLAGLTWTQPLRGGALLTQRAYATRFATTLEDEGGALTLHNTLDDVGLAGSLALPWRGATWTLGYDAARYRVTYRERLLGDLAFPWEEYEADRDTTIRQRSVAGALFADALWRRGRWLVRPGVRAEAATAVGWMGLSPRLAAKYFVRPNLAVSAAASRHTQLLHAMRNEDLPIRLFDLWVTSTRDVPHSRATHLVGGVETWWRDDAWVLRAEGWQKRFADLAEPSSAVDPRIRLDALRRFAGESYGLDVYLRRFDRGAVGGWLSYGWAVSRREREGSSYAPAQDRRHNGNLVLAWRPGTRWLLGARLAMATGTPFTSVAGWYARRVWDPTTGTWRPALPGDGVDARGARNAARYPLYGRLDLGAERAWTPSRFVTVRPYVQVVNASNRRNVFLYDYDVQRDPPRADALTQFPLLPTFGVKVEF